MKTVILMRHAKSSWVDAGQTDFERPLNKRGRRDAPRMASWLVAHALIPDFIVASSAERTRETAELLRTELHREELAEEVPVEFLDRLYHAPPQAYLETLARIDDAVNCLLMIGHNPSIESLVEAAFGQPLHVPTAALAVLPTSASSWRELRGIAFFEAIDPAQRQFLRPKELPDESN